MIFQDADRIKRRPLVGVLCCNQTVDQRASQVVSNRFIEPLVKISGVSVLIIPAMPEAVDGVHLARTLDGLLLTGSCSNVSADRYGGADLDPDQTVDPNRDEVAMFVADRLITAGKPVLGICRGLQEINVLFGGSLHKRLGEPGSLHYAKQDNHGSPFDLFRHRHGVKVMPGGYLAKIGDSSDLEVNSVHEQGIDRVGTGLRVEARAPDGLVEAISARPVGMVLGVQWHPECDLSEPISARIFGQFGEECALV